MKIKKPKSSLSLLILLVMLSVTFAPFMASANGNNYLFILFGIAFLIYNHKYFFHLYKAHYGIFIFIFILSVFYNYKYFRPYSFFYTFYYLALYILIISMLHRNRVNIYDYLNLIRILLSAFCVVLIIQQIEYFSGINPVFNQLGTQTWRLNSLSLEPSLTGMIVNVLFYSLIKVKETLSHEKITILQILKSEPWISFAFLYTVFTCGSSFGLLFFIIILIRFIKLKNLLLGGVFSGVIFYILYIYKFTPVSRIYDMFFAIQTLDKSLILGTDRGAGIRIYSIFEYFENFSFLDIHTWLGEGMAYNSIQINSFLGYEGVGHYSWFIPSFIVDHGIFSFFILMYFIFKNSFISFFKTETILFIFMLINISINTQFFWFVITFFTINKYFSRNINKILS